MESGRNLHSLQQTRGTSIVSARRDPALVCTG